MATVVSVNISKKKGTIKFPCDSITLNNKGIDKDAHAGNWHRQVSLLADESIKKFESKLGREIEYGEFAENITTSGIVLHEISPGKKIKIGSTILEVTQIGKKCHGDGCEIFQAVGNCVMPKEGIFCKVNTEGNIKPGDAIELM